MTLLLDTHVLLWLVDGDDRLGPRTRSAVVGGDARVSAIGVWEIGIKVAAGHLRIPALESLLEADDFPELPFTAAHGRVAPCRCITETPSTARWSRRPASRGWSWSRPTVHAYDVALLDASG